jgi:flagellar hook assembly protein FlgD
VTLNIYNILGQKVATLINQMQDVGYKSVTWDASNAASGVYIYRMQAGEFTETKKLVVTK